MPEREAQENVSQLLIENARRRIRGSANMNLCGLMITSSGSKGIEKRYQIPGISFLKQTNQPWYQDNRDRTDIFNQLNERLGVSVGSSVVLDNQEALREQIVRNFLTAGERKRLGELTPGLHWKKPRYGTWVIVARTPEEESQLTSLMKDKIKEVKGELPRRRFEGLRSLAGI